MAKYLTLSGLQTFYAGLKTKFNAKVDKVEGYGLSKNDLTDELKAQYDAAYQYVSTTDAEKNVIVGVQVNGADLEVSEDRKVNVVVPTKTSDITNDSDYTTGAALTAAREALEGQISNVDGKFANYYNKSEIDTTVTGLQEAIGAAAVGKITKLVVDSIDTENKTYTIGEETKAASADVIYLVPKDPSQPNNVKDEWMLINDAFEKLGDTKVDLSEYAKTAKVTEDIATAKGEAISRAEELNTAMDTRVQAVEAATAAIEAISDEEINEILAS